MTGPVIKAAVVAVLATIAALLIRRGGAEMAAALAIAACCVCLYAAAEMARPLLELLQRAKEMTGLSGAVLAPVLKCVGLALLTHLAAGTCRDGGQGALASAVELAGTAGALYAALPLLSSFLDTLEGLL